MKNIFSAVEQLLSAIVSTPLFAFPFICALSMCVFRTLVRLVTDCREDEQVEDTKSEEFLNVDSETKPNFLIRFLLKIGFIKEVE